MEKIQRVGGGQKFWIGGGAALMDSFGDEEKGRVANKT